MKVLTSFLWLALALTGLAHAQVGTAPARVTGQSQDAPMTSQRTGWAPTIVYRVNKAETDPVDWLALAGEATVMSDTAPDSTQGAGTLYTSLPGTQYKRVTTEERTFVANDWLVWGMWVKASSLGSPTAGSTASLADFAVAKVGVWDATESFRLDGGGNNYKYTRSTIVADTRWVWLTGAAKVTTIAPGGTGTLRFDLLCDQTHAVTFYGIILQVIPSGTLTDADVYASLNNLFPVPDGISQGGVAFLKYQKVWIPQISDGVDTLMVTVGPTGLLAAQAIPSGGGGGSGTVTSFSAGDLAPLFTTSEATATTTPALTFSLSNAAAHTFFGNNTGSTGAPAFVSITAADVPGSALTKTDDTNVTLTLGGSHATALLNAASLTLGWTGTLAKARQHTTTVYNDQGNIWSTGAQDFSAATTFKVPVASGIGLTANGLIGYDSGSNTLEYGENGTGRTIVNTDGAQTLASKTLTTPAIGDFTNATHNHSNNAGGGTLAASVLASGQVAAARGGTGLDTSGSTGVPRISSGTWSADATIAHLGASTSANLATVLNNETGTGLAVFNDTPTLIAPILGTPTSGTLTNATGLPVATGISGLGANVATFLATPSSANLATALTGETGSGAAMFGTTPTATNATIQQAADGDTGIYGKRFTDTLPTGYLFRFQNQAANTDLAYANVAGTVWGQNLESNLNVTLGGQIRGTGAAPTLSTSTGIGTGGTTDIDATDFTGWIQINTGTSPATSAKVLRVTFASAYPSQAYPMLIPVNAAAAALTGAAKPYVNDSQRGSSYFEIWSGSTALAASTTYEFYFFTAGK